MRWLIRRMAIPTLCCILTLTLFRAFFFLGYVPSSSMEPTIPSGSMILGYRTTYLFVSPQVGDIVLFRHEERILVKRIMAIQGDLIEHNGDSILIPQGCYYVLGDNTDASLDSRFWQNPFIQKDDIIARYNE